MKRNQSYKSLKDVIGGTPKSTYREREASSKNLERLYGAGNEKLLQYEKEKELIRKRDETKAELKALLKKYVVT